ncbi:MAG: aldo/keto reductase [Patescibacteria group bacterium]|jgi:aryl-alcohol dehydrogenase-like predicted oxidoreductase
MEYQKLGQTNLCISRIGFGGAPIGGADYGKVNDQQSILAVKTAYKLGINFYDTADIYGFGHSEKILAKGFSLKERKNIVMATKFGVRWDCKKNKSYRDLSRRYILEAVKKSLFNLKINTIPLYQIHYPDPKTPISETMKTLKELQKNGKINFIGCSNFTADLIKEYQKYGRIESAQMSYNILDQGAEKNLFPICKKLKMSIIIYSPLAQGLLSGKYGENTKFSNNDRRNRGIYFTKESLKRVIPIIAELKKLGRRYRKTPAQVAIRWILDHPQITCVLVGIKNPKQAKEALGALGWRLTLEERKKLTKMGKKIIFKD